MSDSAPVFPKLIPLPAVTRPVRVPVARLADVRSEADLPDRLFLGDLVAGSFRPEKKGWRAEWRDADGHYARLRCAGHLSSLEMRYDDDELVTLITAEQFSELGQSIRNIHPGAWLDRLAKRLEPLCNLRVFPYREEDAVGGDFPDGHLLSLVLPVAADRLPALDALYRQMQGDPAICTGVSAHACLTLSVVNYLEGANPGMLAHPVGLVMHHVNALGTPAADMPVRETDADGRVAWTLRRSHYILVTQVHLRDAARVVQHLVASGFIGRRADAAEGYPHGAEFGACLMPFGYEYAARNIWWFDAAGRRRMFYPAFADADDRNGLAAHSGDLFARALLRDAARMAETFKAETARDFMEAMAAAPEAAPVIRH